MGNQIGSLVSGFVKAVGDFFGAPLDFLSGKACGSICGSTWDLICYIENFCVANLLKLIFVLVLLYVVLLFVYLLYKVGVCDCLGKGACRMTWGCMSSCCGAAEHALTSLRIKLKRRRRIKVELRDLEYYDSSGSGGTSDDDVPRYASRPTGGRRRMSSVRSRERRKAHLEMSLRPRSHRVRVGVGGGGVYMDARRRREDSRRRHGGHVRTVHDIRVTRTSRFVRKGSNSVVRRRRRW